MFTCTIKHERGAKHFLLQILAFDLKVKLTILIHKFHPNLHHFHPIITEGGSVICSLAIVPTSV